MERVGGVGSEVSRWSCDDEGRENQSMGLLDAGSEAEEGGSRLGCHGAGMLCRIDSRVWMKMG